MKSVMILGLAMGLAGSAAAASATAGAFSQPVIVRVYNGHIVSSDDLATAAATVRSLLKDAAIELVWRDCPATAPPEACTRGLDANEVIVRLLVAGDGSAPKNVLGNSMIRGGDPACFVTIWVDHVAILARAGNVTAGQLLGRAITHELGHVLLGTGEHSAVGLMRADWTEHELRRDRPIDWMVSSDERKAMRRGLSARLRQSPPATAAAGL